jgi:hypothetical protein
MPVAPRHPAVLAHALALARRHRHLTRSPSRGRAAAESTGLDTVNLQARYKPAGKAPVEAPALTALERYVNVKLQDRYYGEEVAGVSVIFCESAEEARRRGAAFAYRVALEVFAPMPAALEPNDVRSIAALLNSLPKIIRGGKRALGARVDFDMARAVADIARLRAPAQPARWLAPEPDTVDDRRNLARDRWLRAHPRPLVTRLKGIRIYDLSERSARLTWWDLAEVISVALHNEGVLTPGYTEIYVHLAADVAAARSGMMGAEWSEGAVAALPRARRKPTSRDLLDASEVAVLARAKIDHLDRKAIRRAFATVRDAKDFQVTKLRALDGRRTREARIVLTPTGDGSRLRARLELEDVGGGRVSSRSLGLVHAFGAPHYLFYKLVFRGNAVELHARSGVRADATRGKQPRVQRFPL